MSRKKCCLKTQQQIVSSELYLDDHCWEHIFKFIFNDDEDDNRLYFKSLSIVNKQFLSITNRLRLSLTVWNPTCRLLSRLFPRFVNLISLDLSRYDGLINNLLVQISRYPLKLTSLNISNQPHIPARGLRAFSRNITTLNSLICSNIASLSHADLLLIAHCFPSLQQLDLMDSSAVRLSGSMSILFPKLRRMNLSLHEKNTYMNDAWLLHFCKSSEFLEELVLFHGPFFTPHGIASAIRERPTLKALSMRWRSNNDNITSHFIDSILSLKDLTCLDLSNSLISDELLSSIAAGGLPLKKLVLICCRGYSYDGIFSLLSKCQYIQHFDLQHSLFLNDQHVADLCMLLGDLISINLSYCRMLTELSLLSLVRNCLSLSEVKMVRINERRRQGVMNSNSFKDFVVSPQLKSLHLGCNSWLRDENIKIFASIFPNLELLDLGQCHNIYGEGICQVLKRCRKIRHLRLASCLQVQLHGMNFEVPKLKGLNLFHTSVDDETLYMISKSCSELLELFLASCHDVTKKGVMYVVKNCTQLRDICLADCPKLLPNIVNEILFSRPSLRKITFTPQFSVNKRKLFSHYGCFLDDEF